MVLDNQRILMYWLYGLGLVLAYVLYKFITSVTELISTLALQDLLLTGFWAEGGAALVALGLAAAAVEYTRRNERANKFGVEAVAEIRKVTWPGWKDVRGTTLVVIGVTFVVAGILFVFDKIYDFIMNLVYSLA